MDWIGGIILEWSGHTDSWFLCLCFSPFTKTGMEWPSIQKSGGSGIQPIFASFERDSHSQRNHFRRKHFICSLSLGLLLLLLRNMQLHVQLLEMEGKENHNRILKEKVYKIMSIRRG